MSFLRDTFKLSLLLAVVTASASDVLSSEVQDQTRVMVGVITRNTAHTLPNFFGYLDNLNYPKNRMLIWLVLEYFILLILECFILLIIYGTVCLFSLCAIVLFLKVCM